MVYVVKQQMHTPGQTQLGQPFAHQPAQQHPNYVQQPVMQVAPVAPQYAGYAQQQPVLNPNHNFPPGNATHQHQSNREAVPPSNVINQTQWKQGILDGCFSAPVWWMACLTSGCVPYGQNKTRLESLERTGQTHPRGGDACGGDTFIFCALNCCTGLAWILTMLERAKIRQRYGIQGDGMNDCLVAAFCPCCSMAQMDAELREEEMSLARGGAQTY